MRLVQAKLDISALLNLLVREQHSEAMAETVADDDLWSSTLLAVQAHRAGLRLGVPPLRPTLFSMR